MDNSFILLEKIRFAYKITYFFQISEYDWINWMVNT